MLLRGLMIAAACSLSAGLALAGDISEKAAACSACHGENGVPVDKAIPVIWGQSEDYISYQLRDMKHGARHNSQMVAILQDMSKDDLLALAAYFASKPWPKLMQSPAPQADQDHFAAMTSVGGCAGCHQPNYLGAAEHPRLAGQSETYLSHAMVAFRSGERANNAFMNNMMQNYSLDDIKQLALVLAGM